MKFFKSKVPEKDRVPFWQKVAYGLGGPVEGTAIWIPQGNLTPVFNIAMSMNPALLGIVLMLWRIYDAVADQVMGNRIFISMPIMPVGGISSRPQRSPE